MKNELNNKNPELGGAGVKLLIALVILVLIGHAGYNYVPVAYQMENFKQDMQTAVVQGSVMPVGAIKPVDAVKGRLISAMKNNEIPIGSFVEVKEVNKIVQARVSFSKEVPILPFGAYTYVYNFDHTATPSGFLTDN